jgi:hypothetical protein
MNSRVKSLEQELARWAGISVHAHRFGGTEFRLGHAEVGHVHIAGIVDIPFPRSIHDALLADGLAETHPWVPDSGWITFRMHTEPDLEQALWLMRLSYLRYALKSADNPGLQLEQESERLHLSPRFKSLLEPFLGRSNSETAAHARA